MKTNYQIISETIEQARKLGHLDYQKAQAEREPICGVAVKNEKNLKEVLNCEKENWRAERKHQAKIDDIEAQILMTAERLNTIKWLYEE